MNVQTLYSLQRQLDERIETQHGLQGENLVDRKILALLVEVGELANETRCFKFWSSKPSAPQEIVLEEYVDGLHFILSLGLDLQLAERVEWPDVQASKPLVTQFLDVFQAIHLFEQALSIETYEALLRSYVELGHALQFTSEQIERAYVAKNAVNHERQDQNY